MIQAENKIELNMNQNLEEYQFKLKDILRFLLFYQL
jgi:hypothetical protein